MKILQGRGVRPADHASSRTNGERTGGHMLRPILNAGGVESCEGRRQVRATSRATCPLYWALAGYAQFGRPS